MQQGSAGRRSLVFLFDQKSRFRRFHAGIFMGDIYHQGLPDFVLCLIIALFGVLMLIIGFTTRHSQENNTVNFFALGSFAILVGVWSANDTYILQVFTQHPETVRFVNYLYRKRMNFEKAVSIVQEVSGTQLTSNVVDAFMRLVAQGKFRAPDDDGGGTVENIDNIRSGKTGEAEK